MAKKNELARTSTQNHHIYLRYHRTNNNVAVAWLSGCSEPKPGIAARVRYSRNTFLDLSEERQRQHCRQCGDNEVDCGGLRVGSP